MCHPSRVGVDVDRATRHFDDEVVASSFTIGKLVSKAW
jgi:hypothetical protein